MWPKISPMTVLKLHQLEMYSLGTVLSSVFPIPSINQVCPESMSQFPARVLLAW